MAHALQLENLFVRISPKNPTQLEVSHNKGLSWTTRYHGQSAVGRILDLEARGKELIIYSEKGVFRSTTLISFVRL
ncbi:hypothetical protein HQ39_05410 [Porphyromonas sp. COT-108 OH2963]|uniref:hypothetical protein n=1 Tax=Porphyromonas sp. COT-108 OH2963 TaxID=1515614 RepID=UPI00052D4DB5|nr:hypothetical protein [Porphyromonas sp. COT-108 OH2963]KGN95670.1 hypothetical protein HQ39_05410 [Porphyromonas sp. COT-108 OH2963]